MHGSAEDRAARAPRRHQTNAGRSISLPHTCLVEELRPPIQRLFFSLDPIDVRGQSVVPRHVAIAVMESKLRKPASPDLVAFRVIVDGTKNGSPVRHEWELVDHFDPEHGITAMMRTTGYSLSITGQFQAEGVIKPGVRTPDEAMPGERYLKELAKRGVVVRERRGS